MCVFECTCVYMCVSLFCFCLRADISTLLGTSTPGWILFVATAVVAVAVEIVVVAETLVAVKCICSII